MQFIKVYYIEFPIMICGFPNEIRYFLGVPDGVDRDFSKKQEKQAPSPSGGPTRPHPRPLCGQHFFLVQQISSQSISHAYLQFIS